MRKETETASPARMPVTLPPGGSRLLLHSCCAPCSGEVIETLLASEIAFTVFFYNPNIHPTREYQRRKEENARFARAMGVPFVDADYDPQLWTARTRALKHAPERGARCALCFDIRLEHTARFAAAKKFDVMASTLGISRCKDLAQVNAAGARAADLVQQVQWWPFNWRKGGGANRMAEIARREGFYRQNYCGCAYSLRDSLHQLAARQGRSCSCTPGAKGQSACPTEARPSAAAP